MKLNPPQYCNMPLTSDCNVIENIPEFKYLVTTGTSRTDFGFKSNKDSFQDKSVLFVLKTPFFKILKVNLYPFKKLI